MKKKTKTMCKALSVFLAFLIVVQILPLQVLAENITDAIAHKEFIENVLNNPTSEDNTSDAEILYEVEEKRDEYTKVYKKSDGTYTAIMTEEPLHYLYNGKWEEINNSMSLNGNLYTNLDNLFNVELPETIDSNENLTIEKDGYEISFSVDNIEESSATVENNVVVSDTNITVADEAISQTQSSVTYNDVAENTDLQYIVTPNSIKENIIVSDKESVKDTYTFTFETNGLNTEKLDDGSVVFKDENDEIKFRIPRPVMTDSSLTFSYDINVTLIENEDSTVTLEYSPSNEWINDSDRVYPITIDPAIMVANTEVSWVEDTYVMYDSSNSDAQNTNGYNDYIGAVGNSIDNNGRQISAEIYTKFNIDSLKLLGDNIVFTEVQYLFIGASAEGKALAKKITTPTDLTTVTYESKPSLDNETIDYYTSPYSTSDDVEASYIHFNITKPLNEWYNGAENNGFAIVPGNEGYVGLFQLNGTQTSSTGSTTTYTTGIVMDYVDVGGYNETLNYHSQSVGRAGTGYVNDFTQHLSVVRDDLSIDGNIMPVTVGMIYNSATYDKMSALNYNTMMAYGNGWAPNYLRGFVRMSDNQFTYYTENGAAIDYNYTIENDVVTFEETYSDIYGEHGYEIEYIAATDTEAEHIVITRPDGYEERFNNMGLLTSVTNPDYPSQKINIVYDSMFRIDYITDGVDRKYDYIYDNATNLLSKIKCYAANGTPITAGSTTFPLEVNYAYDENKNLISVTFPDGKSATYTYDANGNITSIANIDGYRIVYNYDENEKVTKVTEQALDGTNYVNGNFITYDRLSPTQIKLTDGNGNYEIYQFNSNGTLLYTIDRLGNYTLNNDVGSNNNTYFISSNDYRTNAENLLLNASFEDSDTLTSRAKHWENSSSAFERTTSDNAYFGDYVYTASKTNNTTVYQKQTVEVLSGGEYTFSAYVKSDEANNGKLYLNISSYNGSNTKTKTESTPVESTGGEWQRYSVTLDAPSNTKKIVVEFGFKSSKGTFCVDNVQLEQASSANEYNYIENGSFRENFVGWEDEPTYSIVDTEVNGSNEKAVLFDGNTDGESQIHQIVKIDGKKDDVFTIGGWLKGLFVKSSTKNAIIHNVMNDSHNNDKIFNFTNDRFAKIEVAYNYDVENEDGTTETLTETITVPFCENMDDWQFAAKDFALKGDCKEVLVVIRYSKNANSALVSNIELTKDEDAVVFTDEETPEDTETCPCEDCEEIDCTCTCEGEIPCDCAPCKRRSNITQTDSFGNITSISSFDGIKTIQTLSQYSEDGNYLVSETDENGNTFTYDYSLLNGILNAITDARNNNTTYTYDAIGNLTQVSSGDSLADYTYENDKLIAITHNGFSYNLSYDLWGQLTRVSVGTQPIITYVYGENEYRDRVVSSTYHNDESATTTTEYQYDELGNITEIIINDETKFLYTYDSFGVLTEISSTDSRIIHYTDDRTDILDFDDNYIYSSYTNDDGDFVETIGGITYTSKSYDSTYDVTTGTTTEKSDITATNGKTVGTIDKQDWFGRYTESVIKTESANDTNSENSFAAIKTEYTYFEYDDNKTSNRVETYVNKVYNGTSTDGNNYNSYNGYSYDYDANGNIIAEYSLNAGGTETLRYSYVYDELNQLVRVNDAVAQKTYTYTYDGAGNILTKITYPYTTGELGTATETLNYTYDSTWTDKLISYGTISIKYDNIGNPTEFKDSKTNVTEQFTWSGRQLETYVVGSKTIIFEYDENGLRHRKTIKENNIITEQYDYVWSDGYLISQTYTTYSNGVVNSSNTAKFIYDACGILQGFVLNNTSTYLYTKNLQGDILSIVNESGRTILTYEYDSWGAVTFSATSMPDMMLAYTLSFVSPFTYRGYCYDYDIELYYLQSRYYSPEIGRFINTDDTQIAIATQGTMLGANLFTYCNNQPINFIDPTGSLTITACIIAGVIIGAAVGAGAGYALATKNGYTVKNGWKFWKYICGGIVIGGVAGGILGYTGGALFGASGIKAGTLASKISMSKIRALGKYGEKLAKIQKNTTHIESVKKTATYRIPDILDKANKVIGDVKYVKNLSLTKQLQDYIAFAEKYGYTMALFIKPETVLSGPLQKLVEAGKIVIYYITK